jgi:DNA polymerase (family 10)
LEKGVFCAINPDAHHIDQIARIRLGIPIARKGWIEKEQVLNCRPLDEILTFFQK